MIAIINPSNIERAPYIQYYVDVLEKQKIEYRVIFWNRDSLDTCGELDSSKCISVNLPIGLHASRIKKYFAYLCFVRKVKQIINDGNYQKIVIFTIQLGIYLRNYLEKNFKNNYIFDIRDYNCLASCQRSMRRLVEGSYITVISSYGFKNWLPKSEYVLSHNVRKKLFDYSYTPIELKEKNPVILTIGQIRDLDINRSVLQQIADSQKLRCLICGYGECYDILESEFSDDGNDRFNFYGKYSKKDEAELVIQSSFVNAITPINTLSKDLTTNRFYLSLLYKRPIIVMNGTFQAHLVKEYNIGVIINNVNELSLKLDEYIESYDMKSFSEGCDKARKDILYDIDIFEKYFLDFIHK